MQQVKALIANTSECHYTDFKVASKIFNPLIFKYCKVQCLLYNCLNLSIYMPLDGLMTIHYKNVYNVSINKHLTILKIRVTVATYMLKCFNFILLAS